MSKSYNDRLKALQGAFTKSQASEGGRGALPEGTYQAKISAARLDTVKKGKRKGAAVIATEYTVLTGPQKGRKAWNTYWIESVGEDGTSVGFSILKKDLGTLAIDIPTALTEKSLKGVFESMVDCVVEIAVIEKNGYTNTYLNRLVNADEETTEEAATEEEEETEEETEEEEEETDDASEDESEEEEEEEEEEEPAPKKKPAPKAKPAPAKAPGKKPKVKPVAEEEDEDDDWDSLT